MRCAEYIEDIIRFDTSNDVAAFIAEAIMGAGGIIVPPEPYFKKVKEVLDRHHILLFVDEVQTGFCRTGKTFAMEHYGVEPDIMAMAKAIACGLPLSGFIARGEIADVFRPGEHLTTFGGNAVSCAAAVANINFLERERIAEKVVEKGKNFLERLGRMKEKYPIIGDVRGKGLMIGLELVKDKAKTPAVEETKALRKSCLEKGLIIGSAGVWANVLIIEPPLVITEEELDEALTIIEKSLGELWSAALTVGLSSAVVVSHRG